MKEVIVGKSKGSDVAGLEVDVVDVPVPEPGPGQVLIRIAVCGTNPKDWKRPTGAGYRGNQGDDMAGVVARVGAGVTEFRPGDRVAAFHEMMTPHGAHAEYGVAWQHTTFHLPAGTPFAAAATLPLAALTSVFALYKELRLPYHPWTPRADGDPPLPLVVYGASTAVGHYAVQLAARSNIHPIVAIAGASADAVLRGLLDPARGDAVVDYRAGEAAVLDGVRAALVRARPPFAHNLGPDDAAAGDGAPLVVRHAYDPASYQGGYVTLAKLLTVPGARLATVAPLHDYPELAGRTVPLVLGRTMVGDAHNGSAADRDLAYVYSRAFTRGLQEGWLRPHPYEVVPGGLNGVGKALKDLMDGKAHGVKYVLRISDTDGVEGVEGE